MDLFMPNGVHALVDGQFGSTGKGLFASYLAREAHRRGVQFAGAITNGGPNSGHTFYHEGEKHVLKQLPTFAVKMAILGAPIPAYLSAGAIVDFDILLAEALRYPTVEIWVHRNAAVVRPEEKETERHSSIAAVAGTRSGTGAALARRIHREDNAVAGWWEEGYAWPPNVHFWDSRNSFEPAANRYFMEVSQGFSLGINSQFYPKVTSRECTVMQGIADARIAPYHVTRTYMVARTFPIRVGNVDGHSSGDWYPDQVELSWSNWPGLEPERTTVTNRVRRVATFSDLQILEALRANDPDFVLWNFMNYLHGAEVQVFVQRVNNLGMQSGAVFDSLYGWGPHDDDITPF